jgi:hypothetical protein
VRNVASLQLEQILGDLVVQNVHGRVLINHSQGDIVLRNIGDSITINYCDRDLSLRNVAGVVQAHHVHGDIRLREGLPPGEHLLKADGDIVLRWPVTVALALQASGRTIENHLPLQNKAGDGEALRQEEHGRVYLSGRMGDGDCQLTLESQADIILKPLTSNNDPDNEAGYEFEMDFGFGQMMEQFGEQMVGFGETIVSEINQRLTNFSRELETGGNKQNEQVAQKVERALRRTEEAMRKMQQHRPASYAPPPPPMPPKPPRPGTPPSGATHAPHAAHAAPTEKSQATADDRAAAQMKILEMLQKGQIGVEEANMLLKALE